MGCAIVMLSLTACAPMGADDEDPGPSIPATPQASPTPESPSPSATPEPPAEPEFDRSARSIDDPASLWVVVNKARPLVPVDYVPGDLVSAAVPATNPPTLRAEAADALVAMFDAARAELGLTLQSQSAYRSYTTQQSIFTDRLAREGRERTELFSARPGHSEHQTGLAVDIGLPSGECSFDACFGETDAGIWLAENAHRFGFLLRYPDRLQPIVGFGYEPWHFRYVGPELSAEMHEQGVATLEEFFGLPAAPDYLD